MGVTSPHLNRVETTGAAMSGQSNTVEGSAKDSRPEKPYPEFPLNPHACGSWVKKINGKRWTFGGWKTDPFGEAALVEYNRQKDHIEKYGKRPPAELTPAEAWDEVEESQQVWPGLTVINLVNAYLTQMEKLVERGKRSAKHYHEMTRQGNEIVKFFGEDTRVTDLQPRDFKRLRESWEDRGLKPKSIEGYVVRTKAIFNGAFEIEELEIPQPFHFNGSFKKPDTVEINRQRNRDRIENGGKFFEADEIRLLLEVLEGKEITLDEIDKETGKPVKVKLPERPDLRAMVLLGINCGLGNEDLSGLRTVHIDLEGGWLDYPRSKTEEQRRSKLWTETVDALKEALEVRPVPKYREDKDKFFLTSTGLPLVRVNSNGTPIDALGSPLMDILKQIKLYRKNRGFYALRHTFETVGVTSGRASAVSLVMGHAASGMSRNYREFQASIWNDELEQVAEHVHNWLFADATD